MKLIFGKVMTRVFRAMVFPCAFMLLILSSCKSDVDKVQSGVIKGNFMYCDQPYNGTIKVILSSDRFGSKEVFANQDGAFEFEDIWSGEYTLKFESDQVEFDPTECAFAFDGTVWEAKNVVVVKSWKRVDGTSCPEEFLSSVLQTDDFGFITVGHQGDYQSYKAVIRKYDRDGAISWESTLDDSDTFYDLKSIVRTTNGYMSSGETWVVNGLNSILTTKVFSDTRNTNTDIEIGKTFSAATSHYYASSASSSTFYSNDKLFSVGCTSDQSSGLKDYFLFSHSENGSNTERFKDADIQDGKTDFVSVKVSDSMLYAFGNKAVVDVYGSVTDMQIPVLYIIDKYFLQINNQYAYSQDGFDSALARCVAVDGNSNLFLAIGSKQYQYDPEKAMIIKTSIGAPSVIQWKIYLGNDYGKILDIMPDGEGGVVGTGCVNSDESGVSVVNVFRVDTDGNVKWSRKFEGNKTAEEYGCSISRTKDGGYVVCGTVSSGSGKKGDFLILKLNQRGEMYGSN